MTRPSFLGWWVVYSEEDHQPLALVREVNMLRKTEELWNTAGVPVYSRPSDEDEDIVRLRKGEDVLGALGMRGLKLVRQ